MEDHPSRFQFPALRALTASGVRGRRRIGAILLAHAAVIVMVGGAIIWLTQPYERRGSKPPAGQFLPALHRLAGIDPAVPDWKAAGAKRATPPRALLLVVTCLTCRSGDVYGGLLGRISPDDLPEGTVLRVVGWGGEPDRWRHTWQIDERLPVHVASSPAVAKRVQRAFRVGSSGVAFVYDGRRRWVSTFHAGQLQREDLLADLGAAAAGDLSGSLAKP